MLALVGGGAWVAQAAQFTFPDGTAREQQLEALPGKAKLIKKTYRPPNYETPVSYFGEEFTPNDAFFVRYHLSGIPDAIDAAGWKLEISGAGASTPVTLTLDELKSMEKIEIAAVN
jgi:DMSO/TMAO reductase YedYZ molybdopterin-dependent catalytic subunit